MSSTASAILASDRNQALAPMLDQFSAATAEVRVGPVAYRLSVHQFDRMVATGILTENDRVELLEGALIAKMSKNPPHRVATRKTVLALERVISPEWHAAKEEALQVSAISKPEPDAAVVRAEIEFDATRDAEAADCALVAEVADATLDYDRTVKLRTYATAGIAVYWIINLVERQIEVYSDPTGPTASETDPAVYRRREVFGPDDIVPVVIAGREVGRIRAADLLPKVQDPETHNQAPLGEP
ncbi:MAG TPA: Uma2 family endonuclease [Isosphaeraceae bacterium]|nr:Uma2 family endonuclease [Isosphaeraceae bacterium]